MSLNIFRQRQSRPEHTQNNFLESVLEIINVEALSSGGSGTGITGPTGPVGFTGPTGAIGNSTNTGATGPTGLVGEDGVTGPQGEQGPTGSQGPTGENGVTGPQGPVGEDGATGPQGPVGDNGATGPTGADGNSTNTGSTGPQGIQGPAGAQGIQGPTGAQGIQGPTGAQGIQGPTGTQGIQGPTGTQGIQGPTGTQGIQGPTGTQGIQGIQGPTGAQGNLTGPTGAQGDFGPNNVLYWGAVGDGVTDDTMAFNAAFAASATGCTLYMPGGTYRLVPENLNIFEPPNGFVLYGDGNCTVLSFHPTTSVNFPVLFRFTGGVTGVIFRNFKILWNPVINPSFGPIVYQIGNSDNIKFNNIEHDMGVFETGGARSHFSAIWSIGSGTATNYLVQDCRIFRNVWGFLKPNSATGTERKWTFINNYFRDFFAPQLTFNTPSGTMSDIKVIGTTFENSLAETIGIPGFDHCGGVAGGNESYNFIFSNNQFIGTGTGLHFEEGAKLIVISNNNFRMSNEGVEFLDNNVGGNVHIPQRFVVSGNTFEQVGVPTGLPRGVYFIFDASGHAAGYNFIVTDNYIRGYERGIEVSENRSNQLVIANNIVDSCNNGIRCHGYLSDTCANNMIRDCTTGIVNTRGGMLGKNSFIGNTTNIVADGVVSVGMAGWSVSRDWLPSAQMPTGIINTTLQPMPTGARMSGKISYHFASTTAPAERFGVSNVN
jgi:hypothetical protein